MCYVKYATDIKSLEDLQILVTDMIHDQKEEFLYVNLKAKIMNIAREIELQFNTNIEEVAEEMLRETLENFLDMKRISVINQKPMQYRKIRGCII